MWFAPSPERRLPSRPEDPQWRLILFVSAAVAAVSTMRPWTMVAFERLWGQLAGPPGWQSSAGFTCLCTSLLVAVMTLIETSTPSSRQAVRPASLLLSAIALLSLLASLLSGPGMLRGVSATWTLCFYLACVSLLTLSFACVWRQLRHRQVM